MNDEEDRRLGGWLGLAIAVLAGLYVVHGLVTGEILGPRFGEAYRSFAEVLVRGEDASYWYNVGVGLFVVAVGIGAWLRRH